MRINPYPVIPKPGDPDYREPRIYTIEDLNREMAEKNQQPTMAEAWQPSGCQVGCFILILIAALIGFFPVGLLMIAVLIAVKLGGRR